MALPSAVVEPVARARRAVEEAEELASAVLLPLAAGGSGAAVALRRAAGAVEGRAEEVRGRARLLRAARAAAWRSRAADLYRLRLESLAHDADRDAAALSALAAALRRHAAQVEVRAAALHDAAGTALALGAEVVARGAALVRGVAAEERPGAASGGLARALSTGADEVVALATAARRVAAEAVPAGVEPSAAGRRGGGW